jgi:hypothetical protein
MSDEPIDLPGRRLRPGGVAAHLRRDVVIESFTAAAILVLPTVIPVVPWFGRALEAWPL